jgi:hypothetical protein
MPSVNPVYSDDPYLGCILAKLVTPPHTASCVKLCLSNAENIDPNITTSLFTSASSRTPMGDSSRVSILANQGPGCTPNKPMALVAKCSRASHRTLAVHPPREGASPFDKQYSKHCERRSRLSIATDWWLSIVYYLVYQSHGAIESKQPADPHDPFMGRILVDSIPPPHTAASIKRCIVTSEELNNWKDSQLFVNVSRKSPMGKGHISILTSERPGYTPEDPMAFVEIPHPTFNRRMRVKYALSEAYSYLYIGIYYPCLFLGAQDWKQNPDWLSVRKGEMVHTNDDKPQEQPWIWAVGMTREFRIRKLTSMYSLYYVCEAHRSLAYRAVNAAGKMGCEYIFHLSLFHSLRQSVVHLGM